LLDEFEQKVKEYRTKGVEMPINGETGSAQEMEVSQDE